MSPILGIWASQISGHLWAPAGAYDALATVTVPSGGAASITFAGIPTGYKHLQLRSLMRGTTAAGAIETYITYNGTSSNYYRGHQIYGQGGGVIADSDASTNNNYLMYSSAASTTSSVFTVSITDILDYANTSKNKTIRSLGGYDANGSGYILFRSGLWMNTSAISSMSITCGAGNFAEFSQFALYGVK